MTPLLEVRNLRKSFAVSGAPLAKGPRTFPAVDNVSFDLFPGETLGLVGESGCGKSTTGKLLLRLIEPDAGTIRFAGTELTTLSPRALRPWRRQMQMVFQDPYSSLNPRLKVGEIVAEPLLIHGLVDQRNARDAVIELLRTVGLDAEHCERYPHEFSGGQRQRIGIARALALKPQLIVADEPVSALDVSVQAQVVNLMEEIQERFGLTYLFIAHDLSLVEHLSDRVAVMYLGRIVELAPAAELYRAPAHPYSSALLAAVPIPDPTRRRPHRPLDGEVPSPLNPPPGCPFHPRCPHARDLCRSTPPIFEEKAAGHFAACHFSGTF